MGDATAVSPAGTVRRLAGRTPAPARLMAPRPPTAVVRAHFASLVVAFGFWVWADRHLWFYGDEWDFIARRGLSHPQVGIWFPHNEHWSTLPILLWRAIFSIWHLSSYWPYLIPLLIAHLGVVHLVWRRALRDGSDPWLATALAALLGLLGSGAEDLGWAFQIGFVGSVLLGLAAVDLAAVDMAAVDVAAVDVSPGGPGAGRAGRRDPRRVAMARDAAVSVLSLASLMCSTVGDAMLVAVAVALAARRGPRKAAAVLALPLSCYVLWWSLVGREGLSVMHDTFGPRVLLGVPGFAWAQLENAFGAGLMPLGALIAVAVAAWSALHLRALIWRLPATLGLACAGVCFYCLTALGRDRFPTLITPSRYVYVGMACLLPLVAAALSGALASSAARPSAARSGRALWHLARPGAFAVIGLFLAANVAEGASWVSQRAATAQRDRLQILTTARLLEAGAPVLVRYPFPGSGRYAGYLSAADVLRLAREGVIPAPGQVGRRERLYDEAWLEVGLTARSKVPGAFVVAGASGGVLAAQSGTCATFVPAPAARSGGPGGRPAVLLRFAGRSRSASLELTSGGGSDVRAVLVAAGASGWRSMLASPHQGAVLVLPRVGTATLSDVAAASELVLELPGGRPTRMCGLSP